MPDRLVRGSGPGGGIPRDKVNSRAEIGDRCRRASAESPHDVD
jgi:hypothetical protein